MNNEILLVDIEELIKAYQEGLASNIATNPSDTNVYIGYALPLTSTEIILEANLVAADLSFASMMQDVVSETNTVVNEDLSNSEDEFDIKNYLYQECYTTDIDGKKDENLDFFTTDSKGEFSLEKPVFRQRLTNDFNAKVRASLTKAFDDKYFKNGTVNIKGKDLNFGIEKCFNCVVDINLSFAIPALEFVFDFTKQIAKIKNLLKQIARDIDPTQIYKMICQMGLNFGKNIICPSNLVGIGLLLPMLFTKYKRDQASVRADFSAVLGPIIKTVVGAITSFLENIPKLIIPFIDCIINALRTTVKYIQTLISSVENVYNTLHGSVEKVVQAVHSSFMTTKDALTEIGLIDSDLDKLESEFSSIEKEVLEQETLIADLEQDRYKAQDQSRRLAQRRDEKERVLTEFKNSLIADAKSKNIDVSTLTIEDVKIALILFLRKSQEYISIVLGDYTQEELDQYASIDQSYDDQLTQAKASFEELKQTLLSKEQEVSRERIAEKKRERYFKLQFVAEDKPVSYPDIPQARKEIEEIAGKKLAEYLKERDYKVSSVELDVLMKRARRQASREYLAKQPIPTARSDKKRSYAGGIGSDNAEYTRPDSEKFDWNDWLFAKYGIDVENKYKESDFKLPGKANFAKSTNKTIQDFVETYFIKHLIAIKQYINQLIGNIILSFKAIDKFLNEYIETDIKILGDIQEILHMIRFSRLLYELLKNGFDNCEKIKENKEVFKAILETNHQNLILDDDAVKSQGLDPEDYIAIKTKDGAYATIIDLNDCGDVANHLNVNANNLDSIYEGILNGIYS